MSAMSELSATAVELIDALSADDLHALAAQAAARIGCVVVPDPTTAGDDRAVSLQGPITRLTAKAGQYRAIAEGQRKKILKGDKTVSLQDPQNAERFAEDLEVILRALTDAINGQMAANIYTQVMAELVDSVAAENKALRRLRDDLHATTNRYLERARAAEQAVPGWLAPTGSTWEAKVEIDGSAKALIHFLDAEQCKAFAQAMVGRRIIPGLGRV